ncbi:response regulator [Kiritimatiellaeota bacterium B1221]|nr:response regulator [Kiritimatiellaeota bacterium B1221]
MLKDNHSDLTRQFEELSAEALPLLKDPQTPSDLQRQLNELNTPCDPQLDNLLTDVFQQKTKGKAEYLRMQIDGLRRVTRSQETEQIFRAYGVLELVTPVRIKGKIKHVLFSGPLKVSPWTAQEKETLASICDIQVRELPGALEKVPLYSTAQIKMLIQKQNQTAALLTQLIQTPETSPGENTPLPSSLGLDLLQPGFAEHLDLLFNTVQQELRKPAPLPASSIQRMQTAMQRGRHLAGQIKTLGQQTLHRTAEVSVHDILEKWQKEFGLQHPSLRINLRLDAETDQVTANACQLQHMLFTLMASIADGLPEGRAIMGVSTRNLLKDQTDLLHLEIRDGGGLATFAGVGGQTDQNVLLEQNQAAEEFSDWFTLASRMDAELHVLRDEGVVTRAELLLPLKAKKTEHENELPTHHLWIVEDDDREFESLQHMLQQGEIHCTRFHSAKELRENFSLARVSPDLVLLKYYLPDQRGAEVRTWLYEQDPALPVILISGLQATHPGIATANSLPSTLYLQKPYDSQTLLDMVKMNLDDTLPG